MKFLKQRWGDTLKEGFTILPNHLIDHHEKLGITIEELGFLMKILRHKDNFTIHDSMLSQSVSKKTIARRRKSLEDKGLIKSEVQIVYSTEKKTYHTKGIKYDLNPLYEKVMALKTENTSIEARTDLSLQRTNVTKQFNSVSKQFNSVSKQYPQKSTLYNTNYKTIHKTNYYGEIMEDDELSTNAYNFLDKYTTHFLRTKSLQYSAPRSLYKALNESAPEHLKKITKNVHNWFHFISEYNKDNNTDFDDSPYLLLKGGSLVDKFIKFSEQKDEKLHAPVHILYRDRKNTLPPNNEHVKHIIKKIYQIISMRRVKGTITRWLESKEKHYEHTLEDIAPKLQYLRAHKQELRHLGLLDDNLDVINKNKIFNYYDYCKAVIAAEKHLEQSIEDIKKNGIRKVHLESLFTLARIYRPIFSASEVKKFFGPWAHQAQIKYFKELDQDIETAYDLYIRLKKYEQGKKVKFEQVYTVQ